MVQPARITSRLELDHAFAASTEAPVLIFKHSLTCPISAAARDAYRGFLEGRSGGDALYTLIEVQNAREISNEVAARTGVKHESPQALLVKDGKVVWDASHWDISREALERALREAQR